MPGGVKTSFLLLGTDSGLGTVLGARVPSLDLFSFDRSPMTP